MTDTTYTKAQLRTWAEAHAPAMPQAVWVLQLLHDRADLRRLVGSLADRLYVQSELLSRRAEKLVVDP